MQESRHDCTQPDHGATSTAAGATCVKDPVCGMDVDPHTAKHTAEHAAAPTTSARPAAGRSSSPIPRAISSPQAAPPSPVPEGTIYTCPMHPEIRQVGPGACPICGMALEPELVTRRDAGPIPSSPT